MSSPTTPRYGVRRGGNRRPRRSRVAQNRKGGAWWSMPGLQTSLEGDEDGDEADAGAQRLQRLAKGRPEGSRRVRRLHGVAYCRTRKGGQLAPPSTSARVDGIARCRRFRWSASYWWARQGLNM